VTPERCLRVKEIYDAACELAVVEIAVKFGGSAGTSRFAILDLNHGEDAGQPGERRVACWHPRIQSGTAGISATQPSGWL